MLAIRQPMLWVPCEHSLLTVLQALLSQQGREAVPAAMLIVKVVAERTAAQCSRSASSSDTLDVRWAKALATLAPPGTPAVVTEHLAGRLAVSLSASPDSHLHR